MGLFLCAEACAKFYIRGMKLEDLPRFYAPDAASDNLVSLATDEAHHLHVLRKQKGDWVHVMDGKGRLFEAEVVHTKRGELRVGTMLETAESQQMHTLMVAPTKNIARFEWVIEKATELGIAKIIPIRSERSERVKLKEDRLIRIAVSAAKQSKDLFIPHIEALTDFETALKVDGENKWIAHCSPGEKIALKAATQHAGTHIIAIGPEGDFSPDEVDLAISNGFSALSLGNKRLRTETAAVASALAMTLFNP